MCVPDSLAQLQFKIRCRAYPVCRSLRVNASSDCFFFPPQVNEAACLKAHNDKRALHVDTDPLEWDEDLAKDAKVWADHLLSIDEMVHSGYKERPGQGENLFTGKTFVASTCEDAVDAW